jgi:hypothetical protein
MDLITIFKIDEEELLYKVIDKNVLFKYKSSSKTFTYLIKNICIEQKDNVHYCVFVGGRYILESDIFINYNFEEIFYSIDFYTKMFEKFKYYKTFICKGDNTKKFYKDCGDTIVLCSYIDQVYKLSIITKENYKKQIYSDEYYDLESFEELFPEYFYNLVKLAIREE